MIQGWLKLGVQGYSGGVEGFKGGGVIKGVER